MRLDAFSSGGLCYEQGERPTCKVLASWVSTVKKWTPSRRNSGAQPYFSGPAPTREDEEATCTLANCHALCT